MCSNQSVLGIKATASLEILVTLSAADWATIRLAKPDEPGLHLAAAADPRVAEFPPCPYSQKHK